MEIRPSTNSQSSLTDQPSTDHNNKESKNVIQANINHIMFGLRTSDLSIRPKQVKMDILSDFDDSLVLKDEKLVLIGTPCEYHLYDMTTLHRLDVLIPSNNHKSSIFTMTKEIFTPFIWIINWDYSVTKIRLIPPPGPIT